MVIIHLHWSRWRGKKEREWVKGRKVGGGNERWQEGGMKWEDDQEREQFVSLH